MRTIIVSDVHLGHPGCNEKDILSFLCSVDCDRLIFAGDFWEGWWYSPEKTKKRYPRIVAKIEELAQDRVVEFVRGNHDNKYDPQIKNVMVFDQVKINHYGRIILVQHGHQFDSWFFSLIQKPLYYLNLFVRCILRIGYSDAFGGSHGVAENLREEAIHKHRGKYFYVITGHSHYPEHIIPISNFPGFVNCGDWLRHNSYAQIDEEGIFLKRYGSSSNPAK
jgi:UDP-2,3-diacylglucosamine pyrophosphatase LpxH